MPYMLAVLTGIFVGSVVLSNMVAGKLLSIGWLVFPAGTLTYPLTFLITDSIGEVGGRRAANWVVAAGAVGLVVSAVFAWVVAILPGMDPGGVYEAVFSVVPRVAVASLVAFVISQILDVRLFHLIRLKTGPSHLWFRNNVSTIISQGVDATIFVTIAFAGVFPASDLFKIISGQYIAKIIIALLDTPACYLLVNVLRRNTVHVH